MKLRSFRHTAMSGGHRGRHVASIQTLCVRDPFASPHMAARYQVRIKDTVIGGITLCSPDRSYTRLLRALFMGDLVTFDFLVLVYYYISYILFPCGTQARNQSRMTALKQVDGKEVAEHNNREKVSRLFQRAYR